MFGKSRNSPLGPGEKEAGTWGSNWGAGHRKLGEKSGARPPVPLRWFRGPPLSPYIHIGLDHPQSTIAFSFLVAPMICRLGRKLLGPRVPRKLNQFFTSAALFKPYRV